MQRRFTILLGIPLLAMLVAGVWGLWWDWSAIAEWMKVHRTLGIVLYAVFAAISVVFLPLSSLPLLPVAAGIFGVSETAIASILGWWVGSLIAFQVARFGRTYVEKITSLEAVDRLENAIPKDVGFAGIVVLRMMLPVDVTSFALGLLKRLSFTTYAVATLVGIIPFAFMWSYAGGELGSGEYASTALVLVTLIVAVLILQRLWERHTRSPSDSSGGY